MSSPPGSPAVRVRAGRSGGPAGGLRLVLETIRFSHTLFALPLAALAAVWARGGAPGPLEILLLLVAMVSVRTSAMAFNRVADARLDALNPRTAGRAIPAGRLSARAVARLAAASGFVFVASAAGFYPLLGNPWPAVLALPFLAVLLGYSYTKRFTALSHYVLGLALGLSPVGAWIALTGRLDWPPVVLGAAVMFWTAGFDILYSLQDLDHDREVGLRSIPVRLGVAGGLLVARASHVVAVALLAVAYVLSRRGLLPLGERPALGPWYLAGTCLLAALLVYEHTLIRPGDLRRLNRAFFTVNASGSVAFAVLGIVDIVV